MNDPEAAKALAARFFATFSTGDVPAILALMDEDATWWVSGNVDGFSGTYGKIQLGELLKGVVQVYKAGALRITPGAMTAEGNRVAVEAEGFAELMNGRIYRPAYHYLLELRDGKVLRVREYMDTLHARQIFFDPEPADKDMSA